MGSIFWAVPVAGEGSPFGWEDDFNYTNLDEIGSEGWTMIGEISLNDSAVVLDSTSGISSIAYDDLPSGIVDWRAEATAMWIGGIDGSILFKVITESVECSLEVETGSGLVTLSVGGTDLGSGPVSFSMYGWHELALRKTGDNLSCFVDDDLVLGQTTTGIDDPTGLNCTSQSGIFQIDSVNISANPGKVWEATFGGSGTDVGSSGVETSDGGFAIVGTTSSFGAGGNDAYVIKVDGDGEEVWTQTYGTSTNEWAYGIIGTDDGGIAIIGAQSDVGGFSLWVVRIGSDGTELWSYSYGNGTSDVGFGLLQTGDGGFLITGYKGVGVGDTDVYLIKVDGDGIEEWQTTFDQASGHDWGKNIIGTTDGNVVISGWSIDALGSRRVYLIKADMDGGLIWEGTYGGVGDTYGYGVVETPDGGFIVSGHTTVSGAGSWDFYAVRTDSTGGMVWESTYGGTDEDRAFHVLRVDGGYVLGGFSSSFGGTSGVYIVGIDGDGNAIWEGSYLGDGNIEGGIPVLTSDGCYLFVGNIVTVDQGNDVYITKVGAISVSPGQPSSDLGIGVAAGAVGAVAVGTGLSVLGVVAAGGMGQASASLMSQAGSKSRTGKVPLRTRFRTDKIVDFFTGYGKYHIKLWLFGKESKYRKVEAREGMPFLFGMTQRELIVITVTAILLGISFMLAKKIDLLQPGLWITYILVAGFAIILHDLTHRYVSHRYKVIAEYKFWGLGAIIMFVTALIFGTVYSFPSRTKVNDPEKLSHKQRAILYGAGPLMSFAVFVMFLALVPVGGVVATIALLACSMNLLTAVYSFMPLSPMDGAHVFKWKKPIWAAVFIPMFILYMLLVVFLF